MQKHTYILGTVLLTVGFAGGFFIAKNVGGSTHTMRDGVMEQSESMSHDEVLIEVPEGRQAPSVSLEVLKDPKGGWNAKISTANFKFAPEHVSTEHIFGEGHAHIYVDGKKVNRVYGEWYYLGEIAPGEHEVRVVLNANDHSAYGVQGKKIKDTVTIVVEQKQAIDRSTARTFDLAVADRALEPKMVSVTQGESVILNVASDEAGEFHISGYEIKKKMGVGELSEVAFVADKAGRYNFELHPAELMSSDAGEDHEEMSHEDIIIGAFVVNPR